jgi:predicted house-cleaning noncanonical NTP pyrophosphatase (MazG superfamily)
MPKFILHKLVRDKLVQEYETLHQNPVYMPLTHPQHLEALKRKVLEELTEVPLDSSVEQFEKEIADVQQAINDLITVKGGSADAIKGIQQKKFEKKGGFTGGTFLESLELAEDDPWTTYYRDTADRHKEV